MYGWIYNWGTSLTSLIEQAAPANDLRSNIPADMRACGGGNLSCGVTGRWVTVQPRQRRAHEVQFLGTHAGQFTPPGWAWRRDGWRQRWRQVQSAPFNKFCSSNRLFPKSSFWINAMKSIPDIDLTSETWYSRRSGCRVLGLLSPQVCLGLSWYHQHCPAARCTTISGW